MTRREFLKYAGVLGASLLPGCGMSAEDAKKMAEATRVAEAEKARVSQDGLQKKLSEAQATIDTKPTPTATPNWEATGRAYKNGTPVAGDVLAPQAQPDRMPTARIATRSAVSAVNGQMQEMFRLKDALAYPALAAPSADRQRVFPDVPFNGRPALAEYVPSAANWDYFHAGRGEVALPQYHYRVITGRHIAIPALGIDVSSNGRKGAMVLLVNHFGETATWKNSIAENSFTVAGRVWDMGSPDKVTLASQALLDHYMGRMTNSTDGANCSVIEACQQVEWHVAVVGGGKLQTRWAGVYTKGQ